MVVNHHVLIGTQTQVICKSNTSYLSPSLLSSTIILLLFVVETNSFVARLDSKLLSSEDGLELLILLLPPIKC